MTKQDRCCTYRSLSGMLKKLRGERLARVHQSCWQSVVTRGVTARAGSALGYDARMNTLLKALFFLWLGAAGVSGGIAADEKPAGSGYEVYAIKYAELPDFPVAELVKGA